MMKNYVLSNGVSIPVVGFGTWQIPNGDLAYNAVLTSLQAGYRHLDTAMAYQNEESVGQAIRDSNLNRADLFITTKLPAETKGYLETIEAFNESLRKLDLDYIDLYLIHAPKPWGVNTDGMEYMEKNIESWKAMEQLYLSGKIKAIGVSNFKVQHLESLLNHCEIIPMVNQILVNPNYIPEEDIAYCKKNNILVEAYSPLATGKILNNHDLEVIASKYSKTVAQLCVRWSLQNGLLPLPKSVTNKRIIENIDVFDFEITDDDMEKISKL